MLANHLTCQPKPQGRLSNGASSIPQIAVPSSAAAMARDAAPPQPNALPLGNALTDYDDLLAGAVAAVVQRAAALGGDVQKASHALETAFKAERNVIAAMLECKVWHRRCSSVGGLVCTCVCVRVCCLNNT